MAFHTQNNQSSNLSTIFFLNDTCYPWEDYIENQVQSSTISFFVTSAPSGQVDSKVGLVILVICIITLLADFLFIGLIFSEKQLLYQVLTKLMWNKKIRGVSQAYKNQILIQLPNAFVMDMVSKKNKFFFGCAYFWFLLIIGRTELFYVMFCQHLFLAEQPFHDLNLCERRLVSSLHARVQPAWSQRRKV